MTSKIFNISIMLLGALCFVFSFFIELFNINLPSGWFMSAVLLSVVLLFFPRSILRVNKYKKTSKLLKTLIILNSLILLFLCAFLMANLIYFALYGLKLISYYQGIIYPVILIYCLLESYIDFNIHEKFKKNTDVD